MPGVVTWIVPLLQLLTDSHWPLALKPPGPDHVYVTGEIEKPLGTTLRVAEPFGHMTVSPLASQAQIHGICWMQQLLQPLLSVISTLNSPVLGTGGVVE